jgi:hypothetical protein
VRLDWWSLPGPSRWLDGLVEALRAGRNLIVRLPEHCPGGLREALEQRVGSGGGWCWTPLWLNSTAEPNESPAQVIGQRFGAKPAEALVDAVSLARGDLLIDQVIWLEGLNDRLWSTWYRFLARYADACRDRAPCDRGLFVACCRGSVGSNVKGGDVALSVHSFDGIASSLDMALWTAGVLQDRPYQPLERRLRVAVAVELAGTDAQLALELAVLDLKSLTKPAAFLTRLAQARGWDQIKDQEPCWHRGTSYRLDGHKQTSSALLSLQGAKGAQEIQRRIWKGQVSVLFPFLEQERVNLLDRLKPMLRLPFETPFGWVTDLWELELGHLLQQVGRRVDGGLRRRLHNLVSIRNALAHLEPASASEVHSAISQISADARL